MNAKALSPYLRNDLTTLLLRLLLLYAAWFLCRIVFYLQNAEAIGSLSWSEMPSLLRGATLFDTISILYINALFIVLSLLPLRLRDRNWYQRGVMWIFMATNIGALVINICDGVYFHYARKRFTADELSYLHNNDNSLRVVLRSAAENWYVVLFGIALFVAIVWCYGRIKYRPTQISGQWRYFGVNLAVLVAVGALIVGGIRGGFDRQTRPVTLSNSTAYTSSNLKANLILSNPFCMIRTLGNKAIHYEKFFTKSELNEIYSPYHNPANWHKAGDLVVDIVEFNDQKNPPENINLGKRNVVLFILESFSAEHSALLNPDLYPHGGGYTPYLDSLMREGYYFTNAYSNGRKSIDAMPSIMASIPSYQTPFVLMPQALSQMEAMPWILAQQGYTTSFFNGSSRGSMGFGAFASLTGIENYFSREDYEKAHGKGDFDGYWGVWDMPFLEYMESVLSAQAEPFFASAFTLTSHHPFVVPPQYNSLAAGQTKIHRGVLYTDLSVRRFMELAAKQSWYKNTLFVFVADHVSSETFAPKTLTPTGNSHIINFMYTPDGALRGVDREVSQQIDIMPTVLGLLGNKRPYFAFGRDVINERDCRPMAINVFNENYQAITDSLVLFFDGSKILSAYSKSDTLQANDISTIASEQLDLTERDMKGRIQQYYQHVEAGNYLFPQY